MRLVASLFVALLCFSADAQAQTVQAAVGTFSVPTGGSGTTYTETIGWQPKIIIFVWMGQTSVSDTAGRTNINRGFGCATSPTARRTFATQSLDTADPSDVARRMTNLAVVQITDNGQVTASLDLDAILSTGFRVIVDTQFTTSLRVSYLALGGDGVTAVTVGDNQIAGGTGSWSVTGVGFQGDLVLFASTETININEGFATNAMYAIGAATSSMAQAQTAGSTTGSQTTSQTARYATDGVEALSIITTQAGGPIFRRLAFTSWTSDGFTLNRLEWVDTRTVMYCVIQVAQANVVSFTTRTDTDPIAVSDVGFRPSALLCSSHGTTESVQDTSSTNDLTIIGLATDASTQSAHAALDAHGQPATTATTAIDHDALYVHPSTGTVDGVMTVTGITDTGFTAVMTDPDPVASFVWCAAVGPPSAPARAPNRSLLLGIG